MNQGKEKPILLYYRFFPNTFPDYLLYRRVLLQYNLPFNSSSIWSLNSGMTWCNTFGRAYDTCDIAEKETDLLLQKQYPYLVLLSKEQSEKLCILF